MLMSDDAQQLQVQRLKYPRRRLTMQVVGVGDDAQVTSTVGHAATCGHDDTCVVTSNVDNK